MWFRGNGRVSCKGQALRRRCTRAGGERGGANRVVKLKRQQRHLPRCLRGEEVGPASSGPTSRPTGPGSMAEPTSRPCLARTRPRRPLAAGTRPTSPRSKRMGWKYGRKGRSDDGAT
jgi:hypothetical protein